MTEKLRTLSLTQKPNVLIKDNECNHTQSKSHQVDSDTSLWTETSPCALGLKGWLKSGPDDSLKTLSSAGPFGMVSWHKSWHVES